MRGLAFRRHQLSRTRNRVLRYFSWIGSDTDDRIVGIYCNTRKPCTCWCCSNQRKFMGKTFSEIKADITMADEIAD